MLGIAKLLRRIAGGTPELDHADVSQSTRNGYTVLGGLMLLVATMSAAIAGFTWASVMHTPAVGVAVAVGWFFFSLLLNNMMAWIIDASRTTMRGVAALVVALVTVLVFGALVSAVNTNFVMLWFLDTEIRQGLQSDYATERADKERQIASLSAKHETDLRVAQTALSAAIQKASAEGGGEIGRLQANVLKLQGDYQEALKAVNDEVDGRAPSRQVDCGPRCREKKAIAANIKALHDAAVARLKEAQDARGPAIEAKVAPLRTAFQKEEQTLAERLAEDRGRLERDIKDMDLNPRDGFINRDRVMWRNLGENKHFAFIFVAFFYILECLIGIVKFLMGKTDYHMLRERLGAGKRKSWSLETHADQEAVLQAELASAEKGLVHKRELIRIQLEGEAAELEAKTRRVQALEGHWAALKTAGMMSDEEINSERDKIKASSRKTGGFLKLVAGGKR